MTLVDLLTAVGLSGIISIACARWLASRLIDHRLAKDLKEYEGRIGKDLQLLKAQIDKDLILTKADIDARLKVEVEEYLGDSAAERAYKAEARRRLYTAVGPLRFQLWIASSELAHRIGHIADGSQAYATDLENYFGLSTAYRLVRMFALTELVERQIAYTDFSVDPFMSSLLRFKRLAYACMSGDRVSLDHPKVNWDEQAEHVYHDSLTSISSAMIVTEESGMQRVRRFDEFQDGLYGRAKFEAIAPIPELLKNLSATTKPILWIRLIALGQLCTYFLNSQQQDLGIEVDTFDGVGLLRKMKDPFVCENLDRYAATLTDLRDSLVRRSTS